MYKESNMLDWLNKLTKSFIVSISNPIINPIRGFLQTSKYLIDVLILSQFVRNISLLEAMIVSDGIYSAIKFTKEYIYYKIKNNLIYGETSSILSKNDKRDLINNYNKLYRLNVIDRYILYGSLYFYYKIFGSMIFIIFTLYKSDSIELIYQNIDTINYICILSITLPRVQNALLEFEPIKKYITYYQINKKVFILYSCSKTIINAIKDLDSRIDSIKNYQIFILYKHLNFKLLFDFIKSYLFLYLLYFLRNNHFTYYYYKAIKLAYYYNTGYLFNIISPEESVYIINIVVTEKRWYDLANLEIVHAFYTLIASKYNTQDDIWITMSLYLAKFFTLWSFVCLLKILTIKMNTFLLLCYFIINYKLNNKPDFTQRFVEKSGIVILLYFLILLNTNDLIISSIFVLYKFIYFFCCELLFFINNAKDITKILDFYQKKGKTLKMKTQKLDLSIESGEYVIVSS